MKATKTIAFGVLVLVGIGLLPITRDELRWRSASSRDKAEDYAVYLAVWPSGRHAPEARSRYDDRSWSDAQLGDTLESYQQYEQTHPIGTRVAEARARIEELTWGKSTNTDTIPSLEAYLRSYDTGRFAPAARTRIEDLTWRQSTNTDTIQSLGAYLKSYDTGRFAPAAGTRIEDLTWRQSTNENTIRSLRAYTEAYPKGRFLSEAQARQGALRTDDAPYLTALQKGTDRALSDFLSEFPGHAKEADAMTALRDITDGRDIVDLLDEKKVEVESQGSGIQSVSVRVRRLVPYPVTIRVPVGSYFVSARQSAQNMVTTTESKVQLTTEDWRSISVSAACANRPRDIPGRGDVFRVQRSPHQEELARLMPVLDRAGASYAIRQAAVWIVTDNASYSDLGILISRPAYSAFGGSRTIREAETARAMRICKAAGIDITSKRIWLDREVILRGLNDGDLKKWLTQNGEGETELSDPEQATQSRIARNPIQMQGDQRLVNEKNLKAGEAFLESNAKKQDVRTTPSGLQYQVQKSGASPGRSPTIRDSVKVHYHGTLIDGTVFDSSVDRGSPATFGVQQVIAGWTEVLQLMKPGDKWKVFIPSKLAYGERGVGGKIKPNTTLIFEIELLEIQGAK